MTSIRSLVVFPKLTVHQITVEPKRVKAVYTVGKEDGSHVSNELIYSYDQVYFDRKNAEDVNLASMMLAQVALNYGLFFETIQFDGLFDEIDKSFLRDMMENTSREIVVNKFFHKNEFLKPPFDSLKVEKLKQYTAAKIEFINTEYAHLKVEGKINETDKNKYAILSSGGKDSLLTYGIIKEIGEAHPVFINESGRHWFTAINSHKYYKEIEPNTAKPWCNSDRIFNWMVKQMPFIKENFQNIRADIYPIRLWTVAVFLFGTLPIVRKRNIGNVLIGNEYDTTVKGNHEGISHYNSLYDQSKYFDNALTRYYKRKGWDLYQYSILRSTSELLILKILVKRYPELQTHQVSCHAAHEENGRMMPCGNCEKCRRIVGMLKALDEDPKRCGYTEEQIEKGLKALSARSIKQIGSDASHLYYLLMEKGLIDKTDHTLKLAKEHPEIVKLRFDNERSMMRDLPMHVRKPLFGILAKYSDGSVKLRDRKWHTFTLQNEDYETPYFLTK
ncbi:hypothetical protein HZY62_02190 [Maribacter polysiphoniae]|uniref:7-cyano-7-deazaguanine synthase in queuosine biosynthesis n=1 Tax=Maribacter polysiphoniae TaxID=429344 RepID=A0A316E4C9_9FLAO|nr:hypothetical protein [Maribacter polysiphoniae]MBD1259383.1 hypothetical protein [Maribacter polysiphoniae]PWK24945.1 hypothetical protein LX92_01313 [Maribacter polysiphoniae]